MKIKNERDFFSGLMFIVVGMLFGVGAVHVAMGTSAQPGTGYFPLMLSVLMAVLGAVLLFKSLTIETEGGERVGRIAWRPVLVIVASISVFGATIDRLGLLLAVPLLIVLSSFAGDEFRWPGVLVSAALLTLLSWFIFVYLLKLTIPVWPRSLAG